MSSRFSLIPRSQKADKSAYGHVLVLAGSPGYSGAAILAGRAALSAGSGLVTLGVPQGLEAWIARKAIPEIMVRPFARAANGAFSEKACASVEDFICKRRISVVALGPGLSTQDSAVKFVRRLVRDLDGTIVLDADGLSAFSGKAEELHQKRAQLILTPHRREFERLFGVSYPENTRKRAALAIKLSKIYDVILVLKGCPTLVASSKSPCYVNRTGNPGMAKGGSGDVLTGMIAAFIAQGMDAFEAARWAAHYHGRAADLAVKVKGQLGLLATDIVDYLPRAFARPAGGSVIH